MLGARTHMAVSIDNGDAVPLATDYRLGDPLWTGTIGGETVTAQIRPVLNGVRVDWRGYSVIAHALRPHIAALKALMPEKAIADTARQLLCPMPGLVVS